MSSNNTSLDDVVGRLKTDAKSPHPQYPSQSLYAVQDETVAKSLTRRFQQGAKLRVIRALPYDFDTGLNRLCFEFENGQSLGSDDLLVLLDTRCAVVAVIDPFDVKQPNRVVPPLATLGGAMPFVLDRPSASTNMPFNETDLAPQDARGREYMARMLGGFGWWLGGGVFGTDPCGPEANTTTCTYCSFSMGTMKYLPATGFDRPVMHMDCSQMDSNHDDCGIFPS